MEAWERGECIAHIPKSMATNSPGPAYYHVSRRFKKRSPVILMKGRHDLPPDRIDAPYYNFPSLIGKVTKVGLHGRAEVRPHWEPPGPNYMPPKFGSDAHKIAIAPPSVGGGTTRGAGGGKEGQAGAATSLGRRRNPDETPGPGPAASMLREHSFDADGRVGYTIKGFHDFNYDNTISPGPGKYMPRFQAVLPAAPKIAFHDRPKQKDPQSTPGYRELGSTLSGPKWTMKARAGDQIEVI
jgi:hypothetical protein